MTIQKRLTELEKHIKRPDKPILVLWESLTANDPPGVFHVGTESGETITRAEARERYQDTNTLLYVIYEKEIGRA